MKNLIIFVSFVVILFSIRTIKSELERYYYRIDFEAISQEETK